MLRTRDVKKKPPCPSMTTKCNKAAGRLPSSSQPEKRQGRGSGALRDAAQLPLPGSTASCWARLLSVVDLSLKGAKVINVAVKEPAPSSEGVPRSCEEKKVFDFVLQLSNCRVCVVCAFWGTTTSVLVQRVRLVAATQNAACDAKLSGELKPR